MDIRDNGSFILAVKLGKMYPKLSIFFITESTQFPHFVFSMMFQMTDLSRRKSPLDDVLHYYWGRMILSGENRPFCDSILAYFVPIGDLFFFNMGFTFESCWTESMYLIVLLQMTLVDWSKGDHTEEKLTKNSRKCIQNGRFCHCQTLLNNLPITPHASCDSYVFHLIYQ